MAQEVLRQILDQIKTLDLDELEQVNRAVQAQLTPHAEAPSREAFYGVLRASGLVKRIKPAPRAGVSKRRFAHVQGKPVSQTIIDERR